MHNLRSTGDNRYILDDRINELIVWIFRFGIPLNGQNTAHFATHAGNGNLNINASVLATALPNKLDSLKDSLSKYLSLSSVQLNELMPELKNVHPGMWDGQSPIDPGSFGPRLVAELNGVISGQGESVDLANIAHHFNDSASAAKLIVSPSNALRLVASMLSKRFVILTGLSGSGKTKLAHAFAAWISETEDQYRLVAVGADWTTNENVVGYQDALQVGVYRKPSNGALDVILRAESDPVRPYFLILDEMNLSHVERYFADILSAVESGQEIALHSAADSLKASEDDPLPVPPKLRLPENLFIVGTVNVDETTYMFSPKVLDRANVIEFRATASDIAAFLDAPAKVDMGALAGKGAAFGPAFVAEASASAQLDDTTAADLKARLTEIFDALAPIGAEFGFRTAYEITRFTHFHAKLTGAAWQFKDALDAQVLQKLLPKLHGSERRLGPVLKVLETICETHQCAASLEKIRRMQDRLKDGFTSFAEA